MLADVPNIKSAAKWVRQSTKRRVRNLDTKTRLKTLYKKGLDQQPDSPVAREVASEFDKAAKRGSIHKNKASRKKSRLAKAQAVAAKAAAAPAKTAKRTTKKTSSKK